MDETRRKPLGHDALYSTISDTEFLYAQLHKHGWAYQGLLLLSHGPLGGVKVLWHEADSNRLPFAVHSRTQQPPDHDERPKLEDQLYTSGP